MKFLKQLIGVLIFKKIECGQNSHIYVMTTFQPTFVFVMAKKDKRKKVLNVEFEQGTRIYAYLVQCIKQGRTVMINYRWKKIGRKLVLLGAKLFLSLERSDVVSHANPLPQKLCMVF